MARILIGNIKGPQGPKGEQGIQGPVGPVGPQGPLPPLANNGTTEEAGKAALDAAYGKVLRDDVDQLNRDMEYKSVSVEKNADCVADSYSLGFKKSGICVLTLDV
ncbi:MAG: hypothetical protein ACOX8K_13870, partial [Lachnospiraceae bacterium]